MGVMDRINERGLIIPIAESPPAIEFFDEGLPTPGYTTYTELRIFDNGLLRAIATEVTKLRYRINVTHVTVFLGFDIAREYGAIIPEKTFLETLLIKMPFELYGDTDVWLSGAMKGITVLPGRFEKC